MHIKITGTEGGSDISTFVEKNLATIESKLDVLPRLITLLIHNKALGQNDLREIFNDYRIELHE